jgi:hypothetical protein
MMHTLGPLAYSFSDIHTLASWDASTTVNFDLNISGFTQQIFAQKAEEYKLHSPQLYKQDLVWKNDPRQWHQQVARIVDHRFSTFDAFEEYATKAKQGGAGALMLVQIQKTEACPGPWYNGLQLCDHINGTFPAADGTLEKWQALVQKLKPMRLMWWANVNYWSVQGQAWKQAAADTSSDVGQWFSWNATAADQCDGTNPKSDSGVEAQGSWGSNGAGKGIQSASASLCSDSYTKYMVDAMANSWTKNLGIDGYTIDCSANYQKGSCGQNGMLQCPNGDGLAGWANIVGKVRKLQPQVVYSGEGYGSWEEVISADSNMGGQGFGSYHTTMQKVSSLFFLNVCLHFSICPAFIFKYNNHVVVRDCCILINQSIA